MITPDMIMPYIPNPVKFARDIIGVEPEDYQARIMMDVARNRMVTVKSGHGTGKTALAAWLILWFLGTRPFPKVPCTAPTEHQLKDILWSEIAKWLYSSPLRSEFVWTSEKVYLKTQPETWFAVARVARKPDALQGFHAKHLFFVLDEASGINDALFEPVLGALTEDDAKLLMIGNPTQLSGFFYKSHTKDAELYCRHTLNAEESPRVGKAFIERIASLYGKESDVYRVRVLGLFPKAEPDSFIGMGLIERGLSFFVGESLTPHSVNIGVDVARFGDDETVIQPVFEYVGQVYKQLEPKVLYQKDTMETAGNVVDMIRFYNRNHPGMPVHVKVDETGIGAGVVDKLEEILERGELRFTLTPINFGSKGGTLEEEPIPFANYGGLIWGRVKHLLHAGRLALYNDEVLIAQLNNRKYRLNSDGEIVLERKEDMKKRGVSSPDRADALAIALAPEDTGGVVALDLF